MLSRLALAAAAAIVAFASGFAQTPSTMQVQSTRPNTIKTEEVKSALLQKKQQLLLDVDVLNQLKNPGLSDAERIALEQKKTSALIATDETELDLKNTEIKSAKSRPQTDPEILSGEIKEAGIMAEKLSALKTLDGLQQKLISNPGDSSLDRQVAALTAKITQNELDLKTQQVVVLTRRFSLAKNKKAAKLKALLAGEQNEVVLLQQLRDVTGEITDIDDRIHSPDASASAVPGLMVQKAAKQLESVGIQLDMKKQNISQIDQRLNR